MKIINLRANSFKPNLRILKNYIITFEDKIIELYDLKGNLLDNVIFRNRNIVNIEIINDNYMIVATSSSILIMKINFEFLEFHEVLIIPFYSYIKNIFLIKNKKLLVICFETKMAIFDINNLNEKAIQVIYNASFLNFNFNQNIFISSNYEYISLYQNIKGTQRYQLSSKLKIEGKKYLTKLNGQMLMILLNNELLYTMNIRNMKITQIKLPFQINYGTKYKELIYKFIEKYKIESFLYNNKNNIYIYAKDRLYYIKYINNEFQFIKSFEFDELNAINYISNKYIKLNYLKINCISNFKETVFSFVILISSNYYERILYDRPNKMIKMINIKKPFFKKEFTHKKIFVDIKKKNKNKFIKKKNLNTKKIVNNPKSFKKNYR